MRSRLALGGVLGAALSAPLHVATARAGGPTSSLSWVELAGAEGCGGAPAIATAVEKRLGRHALVSPAQADRSIEGYAERTGAPPRFHAVIVLRSADGATLGTREIESRAADCGELRASIGLAVALMIDPDAVLTATATATPTATPTATETATPTETVTETETETETATATATGTPTRPLIERVEIPVPAPSVASWRVEPSASAALGYGFLPSASAGALVGVTIAPPRFWPIELVGGAWGSQSVATAGGTSTRFTSVFGGAGLCPLSVRRTLGYALCAGAEVGALGSASSGFVATESGSVALVDLFVDAHLVLPVAGPVAVRGGGALTLGLVRSEFVYEDQQSTQSLFTPSLVAAIADLGVAVSLP